MKGYLMWNKSMDTLSPVVVALIIGSSHAIHFVSMRLIVRIMVRSIDLTGCSTPFMSRVQVDRELQEIENTNELAFFFFFSFEKRNRWIIWSKWLVIHPFYLEGKKNFKLILLI
jgi:hypothetical protein